MSTALAPQTRPVTADEQPALRAAPMEFPDRPEYDQVEPLHGLSEDHSIDFTRHSPVARTPLAGYMVAPGSPDGRVSLTDPHYDDKDGVLGHTAVWAALLSGLLLLCGAELSRSGAAPLAWPLCLAATAIIVTATIVRMARDRGQLHQQPPRARYF